MLGFFEIGEDRLVRPAPVAELRPSVVVERIAAHIHHAVDRTRSAKSLASRDRERAAVEVRLRFGVEPPTVAGVVEELHEAHWNIDPHRIVGWAGFQQQDLRVRVLGEPVGHYATGRTSADDDVVVIGHSAPP